MGKAGFLSFLLFSALMGGFTSCASKQPVPPLSVPAAVQPQVVPIWEHRNSGVFEATAPKKGFVPVPAPLPPPPPPPADDGFLDRPEVIPVPEVPGANLSIDTLMDMYRQEFKGDMWILTRSTSLDRLVLDPYFASLLIDETLNIKAAYDNKNVQVDIVQQIKEEKRLTVYYLYRYLHPAGAQTAAAGQKYFKLELTSLHLFSMLQYKRQGALGFEIPVREVTYAEIPGLK